MSNARLAGRYAKSLLGLAAEQSQVEVVYADMKYIQAVCDASGEFVNLLRSPIIKADQKNSIINAVTKDKVGALTNAFTVLLVKKGRESYLPEMATAFIEQYNEIKGIHQVTLTTAVEVGAELKKSIEEGIRLKQYNKTIKE
jgi:F-type H+-transporting ATPase subunit delta